MILKKIYIDGFRHFKNFKVEPYPQSTLLCGLNGTGKTTVIEVIHRLQTFFVNASSVTLLCKKSDIPRWEMKEYGSFSCIIGIDVEINDAVYAYEIVLKHNLRDNLCRVDKESLKVDAKPLFSIKAGNATVTTDDHRQLEFPVDWDNSGITLAGRLNSQIRIFLAYMKRNIVALSINPFSDFSETHENGNVLKFDASNFSAWYEKMLDENIAGIASSFDKIKPFIKGFTQFSFSLSGDIKRLTVDIQNPSSEKYRLTFNELSHGQKILCILHLIFHICPENSTILIDEFENFLSPVELQPLYDLIQDMFEEKNTQFIFVSHHQKTLNWFRDSAMVFSLSEDSTFVRVDKFPESNNLSIEEYLLY